MHKFLTSFHYFRKSDLAQLTRASREPVMLFGDSGAFSAASQGADVTVDDYDAWLTKWRGTLTVYSNLDVIGDHVATMRNQRELERRGHKPLPVFHVGSPWKHLEELCEQYPYIALGGMVPHSMSNLGPWLVRCFKTAAKYGTVFHGFGQTRQDYLMDFPWYSVDSSSWGAGHRFGRINLWDDRRARFVTVGVGDKVEVMRNAELIRAHHCDPAVFADRAKYHRKFSILANATAWQRYEQFLRRRHGEIRLRDDARNAGLHLYLAEGSIQNLVDLAGMTVYLAIMHTEAHGLNLLMREETPQ